jgi:hypothetical protein
VHSLTLYSRARSISGEKLKSTNGTFGLHLAHNTDVMITGLTMTNTEVASDPLFCHRTFLLAPRPFARCRCLLVTKLGPFEILAPIGKGGMGEVYRAHDSRLKRDVAIKVSNVQFTERFTREARAIATVNDTKNLSDTFRGDLNVRGLQIAVDDVLLVRGFDAVNQLLDDGKARHRVQRAAQVLGTITVRAASALIASGHVVIQE